jgi:hypothetical protein
MGHALCRLEGDVVARADDLALRETDGMALDNLLGEGLRSLGRFLENVEEVCCWPFLQRVEDIRGIIARGRRAESAWGEVETG